MGFRVIDNFLTKPRLNLVRYEFRKLKENIPLKWFSEPYPGMKVKHTKKLLFCSRLDKESFISRYIYDSTIHYLLAYEPQVYELIPLKANK